MVMYLIDLLMMGGFGPQVAVSADGARCYRPTRRYGYGFSECPADWFRSSGTGVLGDTRPRLLWSRAAMVTERPSLDEVDVILSRSTS